MVVRPRRWRDWHPYGSTGMGRMIQVVETEIWYDLTYDDWNGEGYFKLMIFLNFISRAKPGEPASTIYYTDDNKLRALSPSYIHSDFSRTYWIFQRRCNFHQFIDSPCRNQEEFLFSAGFDNVSDWLWLRLRPPAGDVTIFYQRDTQSVMISC